MTQDLQSLEIRDQMDDEDLSEGLDSEADDVITFEVVIVIKSEICEIVGCYLFRSAVQERCRPRPGAGE